MADGVCFGSGQLPSTPAGVFSYYSEHFSAAVALCRLGNQTACQLLANLCVLQTYSREDPACEQSRTLAVDILPTLYYPERGADEVLARTDIRTRFVVREGAEGSLTLPLVVVSFALNGTFLGVHNISDQILLCQDRPSHTQTAWRVGVTYQTECALSLSELSTWSNFPVFYDIFLRDREGNMDQLYPIPILVENYQDATRGEVNRGSDPGSWQFVRRFYLAESVTDTPQYARTMELRVMLNSNGMIFPPYLLVSYNSWSPDTESSGTLPASFGVEYRQDGSGFVIGIAVGSCSIYHLPYTEYSVYYPCIIGRQIPLPTGDHLCVGSVGCGLHWVQSQWVPEAKWRTLLRASHIHLPGCGGVCSLVHYNLCPANSCVYFLAHLLQSTVHTFPHPSCWRPAVGVSNPPWYCTAVQNPIYSLPSVAPVKTKFGWRVVAGYVGARENVVAKEWEMGRT